MKNKSLSKIALMGIASGLAISGQASAEFEASSTFAAVGCNSRSSSYQSYSGSSCNSRSGYSNNNYYSDEGYQSSDNSGYNNNGYYNNGYRTSDNNGSYGRESHSCGATMRSYPNAPRANTVQNQNAQQNSYYDQNAAVNDVNSNDYSNNPNRNVNNSNANSSSFNSSSNYSK